ncbi:MAG: hypothetical protein OEM82_12875 [Acidobacteriota bacterium]|nr:hypothetical protein [Acidobacteriota bacterium]MDH3529610.1 hypothetical protein [Acidobacteriota bacterium]
MSNQDIHVSVTAEDLEEVVGETITVGEVFASLISHPAQVVARWNWKSALLGAALRASFYFTVYQASRESFLVTFTAVMVELSFRFFTSGISGSLVQSFRKASPAWLAMGIVTVSLPIFGHSVEFVTHFVQEEYFASVFPPSINSSRQKAFAVSVLISVLSALFNIFLMRNGVMLVGAGEETKSLWGDFKSIPILLYEFILFLPRQIIQFLAEAKFHYALGAFAAFGLIVGGILGIFRGKWSWAIATAAGSWAILLSAIIIVYFVMVAHRLYRRWYPDSDTL